MRQVTALGVSALAAMMMITGCATAPEARMADNSTARAQVRKRIEEIFDAAAKKDMPRLDSYHLYGPAFTKFGAGEMGRLDSEAARKGEHDGLGSVNGLSMRADDLKIDVFGDTAIATFIMNYSFKAGSDTVAKQDRSTLVFARDHGSWKIVHEHFSPFKAQ